MSSRSATNRAQSLSLPLVNSSNLNSAATFVPPSMLGVMLNGDGSRTVSFAGVPDYTYRLQATTNLWPVDWNDVGTNTVGLTGTGSITETISPSGRQRFYRVVFP